MLNNMLSRRRYGTLLKRAKKIMNQNNNYLIKEVDITSASITRIVTVLEAALTVKRAVKVMKMMLKLNKVRSSNKNRKKNLSLTCLD